MVVAPGHSGPAGRLQDNIRFSPLAPTFRPRNESLMAHLEPRAGDIGISFTFNRLYIRFFFVVYLLVAYYIYGDPILINLEVFEVVGASKIFVDFSLVVFSVSDESFLILTYF